MRHPKTSPHTGPERLRDMRSAITKHLSAEVEATASQIAKALGQTDVISAVIGELNQMRTDGVIDCRPEKGGMSYWLTGEKTIDWRDAA